MAIGYRANDGVRLGSFAALRHAGRFRPLAAGHAALDRRLRPAVRAAARAGRAARLADRVAGVHGPLRGTARAEIRDTFAAFCAARPPGAKFAHRACDRPAGSSPSMKWVNPPVAYMLHAGVPLLRAAGAHLPAHERCDARRASRSRPIRGCWRARSSGRARTRATTRQADDERLLARLALVDALREGRTRLGLRLLLDTGQRDALVDDASADTLDAVLCLLQAAWACDSRASDCRRSGSAGGLDPVSL